MTFWLVAVAAAVALTGCAAESGASERASASPRESASTRESLRPGSVQPSRIVGGGGSDELTGALGADSIEGGCAYLQAEDRTRYEVIYPQGWTIRAAPLELRNPDGEVVATGGEQITVRGSEAGDMMSICQIGPIFRAVEVVSIED